MTFPRVRIPPRSAQRKGFSPTAGGHNHEFRKRRLPPETEERPLRRTVLLEVGHSGRCRPQEPGRRLNRLRGRGKAAAGAVGSDGIVLAPPLLDQHGRLRQRVVQHMRALPHREVAAAIRTARESTVLLAVRLAFEFLVLTAARWGEVRWAEWTEIDRENGVWTVPAKRMKSNREHRVPLCGRAVDILDEARKLVEGTSPFLFPNRVGKQLEEKQLRRMFRKHGIAAVPHGFRSSFRDWAAEETDHPREVIEAALAHVVQNRVEAAYRRTDLFERRRRLMGDWTAYLA